MSKRQKHRDQVERKFWADKQAAARTPEQRAAVEWDRVRAEIRDLPADERDPAWQDLAAALAEHRLQMTQREVHT